MIQEEVEQPKKVCGDSECFIKNPQLLTEFSPNSQRKDGRNLYCRACCRRRVYAGRAKQRERKQLNRERTARAMESLPLVPGEKSVKPDRDTRVWIAISVEHARTQKQIKRMAHIGTKDELGIALAELMLNREWVKSDVLPDGERVYFPNPELKKAKARGHGQLTPAMMPSGRQTLSEGV